jgi:hypothetical protein
MRGSCAGSCAIPGLLVAVAIANRSLAATRRPARVGVRRSVDPHRENAQEQRLQVACQVGADVRLRKRLIDDICLFGRESHQCGGSRGGTWPRAYCGRGPRPGEALDQRDVQLGLTSHQYPLSRLSYDEQIQNSRCNFVPLDCVEGK